MKSYLALLSGILFTISLSGENIIKPFYGSSGRFTKLVWHDEFSDRGLPDSTRWIYEKGYIRNHELQYYTKERLANTYQKNGLLHLVARNDSAFLDGTMHFITSGSIITKGKAHWKYGRIEVRAKIPSALGSWPAIWMMPETSKYGSWPQSGELDIMEHVGYMPDSLFFNVHTAKSNNEKNNRQSKAIYLPHAANRFHVYAVEWTETSITWYVDNRKVHIFRNEKTGWETWPFNQDFYLILNLAFGGSWGGTKGIDMHCFPLEYVIDYVRIFQQ